MRGARSSALTAPARVPERPERRRRSEAGMLSHLSRIDDVAAHAGAAAEAPLAATARPLGAGLAPTGQRHGRRGPARALRHRRPLCGGVTASTATSLRPARPYAQSPTRLTRSAREWFV